MRVAVRNASLTHLGTYAKTASRHIPERGPELTPQPGTGVGHLLGLEWEGPAPTSLDRPGGRGETLRSFRRFVLVASPPPFRAARRVPVRGGAYSGLACSPGTSPPGTATPARLPSRTLSGRAFGLCRLSSFARADSRMFLAPAFGATPIVGAKAKKMRPDPASRVSSEHFLIAPALQRRLGPGSWERISSEGPRHPARTAKGKNPSPKTRAPLHPVAGCKE